MPTLTTTQPQHFTSGAHSVLGTLRHLVPQRAVTYAEARRIAEFQAHRLVELINAGSDGIQEHHIAGLPRIRIVYASLPEDVSGSSHWSGEEWIITLARGHSLTRQRFTLLHEYKHIVDHGRSHLLYTGSPYLTPDEQAERIADYFAGCALVSKQSLKSAWGNGIQRLPQLAAYFDVSQDAIAVRLQQTGLTRASDELAPARCGRLALAGRQP